MREMNWIWSLGAPLVRGILTLMFRVRIEGLERVPRRDRAILACNHVSVLDGPVLAAVVGTGRRRATRFLIASEIFDTGWGWILRQARQVPIRRGRGDTTALDLVVEVVKGGAVAGIFPEGRVSDDPSAGLQRFRSGISRVAIPSGAQVIPVGIWGTHTTWPKEGFRWSQLRRRPVMAVVFGDPIAPPSPGDREGPPGAFRRRLGSAIDAQILRARAITEDLP